MIVGALPFAALGLLLGYLFDANSAQGGMMITYFALAILGGLWVPVTNMAGRSGYHRRRAARVSPRESRLAGPGRQRPGPGRRRRSWPPTRVAIGALVLSTSDVGGAVIQGFSIAMIGFLIYSVGALQRTNLALEEARHELARLAVADERARIARDLHDTLGHSLSLITLKSELAGRLLPDDPAPRTGARSPTSSASRARR